MAIQLTRSRVAPLLSTVRGKTRQSSRQTYHEYIQGSDSDSESSHDEDAERQQEPQPGKKKTGKTQQEEDVDHSPESSPGSSPPGDPTAQDPVMIPSSSSHIQEPQKLPSSNSGATSQKSSKGKPPARRSKRKSDQDPPSSNKRLKSGPSQLQEEEEEEDVFALMQPSSQMRSSQKAKTYLGSSQRVQNLHTSQQASTPNKSGFKLPGSLDNHGKKKRKSGFSMPTEPSWDENKGRSKADFQMPDDDDDGPREDLTAKVLDQQIEEEIAAAKVDAEEEEANGIKQSVPGGTARCQFCLAVMPEEYLEAYDSSATRKWRDREAYCQRHRVRSAEALCRLRGWPHEIRWRAFERRFGKHRGELQQLVTKKRTSYFRNSFAENHAAHQARRGQRVKADIEHAGQEIEAPGYYGHKGGRAMLDWLAREFRGPLVQLAAADALVAEVGRALFVQAVLVPELATRLVMDDLKVDEDDARAVLRESTAAVGDLVNVDDEERVVLREGDSDSGEAFPVVDEAEVIDLS